MSLLLGPAFPIGSRRDSGSLVSFGFAPRNLPRPILPGNVPSSHLTAGKDPAWTSAQDRPPAPCAPRFSPAAPRPPGARSRR